MSSTPPEPSCPEQPRRGRKPGGNSLQQSLASALRQQIADAELAPGSKLPSFRHLASEFGVSTMTVFKALEQLEQENRIYRIAGVGAFVKPKGPGEIRATQNVLGFSAGNLASPLTLDIMHGVEEACQKKGWGVQIFNAQFDDERQLANLERLHGSGLRGGIVMPPCGPACIDLLGSMARTGFPLVFVDQLPPGVECDFVASDHEGGAYLATRHLLEQGFRQVLMLTVEPQFSGVAGRIRGYQRALRGAGIEPRPEWMIRIDQERHLAAYRDGRKWFAGYTTILPILRQCTTPLAILAIDAYVQWGVYEACRELGLEIPADVSVIGFDDSEISLMSTPPMTIISQRTDEIGRVAVNLLVKQITALARVRAVRKVFTHHLVEMDLIERGSVGIRIAPWSAADK